MLLPLPFLTGHELQAARILPQVVEVRIFIKEGITGETVVCGHLQKLNGWFRLMHQDIGRSDDVGSVVEMLVAFPNLDGAADALFGSLLVASGGGATAAGPCVATSQRSAGRSGEYQSHARS